MKIQLGSILLFLPLSVMGDEVGDLLRDLKTPDKARGSWEKLVAKGPSVVPRLLGAMDTPDTVAANWLRLAYDRLTESGKDIDAAALVKFVSDRKRQGRARRLALDTLERLQPGSRTRLLRDALDDPEFRYDAIDLALDAKPDAAMLRRLFDFSRDLEQARRIQKALKDNGVEVSVAGHLGFLREWYAVGPFDADDWKGFKTVYPPEKGVDLKEMYDGKGGKRLEWKRWSVKEVTTGKHAALVDMRQALGETTDAVGYAWTAIRVDEVREVEFRGAADDNFTVWVNGERVFGFEEYRNGVRLDRHRFKVKLKAGTNTVLVKVVQAPSDETHKEPNWEFLLRLCDETGKGIAFTSSLP